MKDEQHEQLFTELTPEQASVIEGGKTLRLYSIKANKAGADPVGNDEPYIIFKGNKVWSGSMGTGDFRAINKGGLTFQGTETISLYDDDASPNRDDLIKSFLINSPTGKPTSIILEGSGSSYTLNYEVLNP